MFVIDQVAPGDIICVRTNAWPWGWLIRIGAWLRGRPATVDHVAIYHHRDLAGIAWAVEGRPGGVGWVDVSVYNNRWALSNAGQPKTAEQRRMVCDLAEALLQTPYDWSAVASDAMNALHARDLWASREYGDKPPGQVVCSSLASWVYRHVGLAQPATRIRVCTPGDWALWITKTGWSTERRG